MVYGFDISERKLGQEKRSQDVEDLERKLAVVAGDRSRIPSRADSEALPFNLTDRELETLRLMAVGLTNVEIAEALSISGHTVKSHVTHIFNKLGVNDRTQAAVLATFYELISPPEMPV
jgi:DNA-binding CsgD family transcriptional regulator